MSEARVSIVVVSYNSSDVLSDCLASIELHASGSRIYVVDNASADDSVAVARQSPGVSVIQSESNDGFSRANNRALRAVETEFALILNPDARLTASTLPQLLAAADRHSSGVVFGPRTVHEDGKPQVSFGPDLSLRSEYRQRKLVKGVKAGDASAIEVFNALSDSEREVDWVSGSCMLLRMEAARAADFFDERYFLYEEDADLCLRLRKRGGKVVFVPTATVVHALGTSMAKASERARQAYDDSHRLYYRLHRNVFERTALVVLKATMRLRG